MSKKFFIMNRFRQGMVFLLLWMAASGCGLRDLASGKIEPPQVAFKGLTIYPPESQCWPLTASLLLTNPNPEPLRITGYDYELAVEGAELVQGESVDSITLPAGGESLVEVPVLLKLRAVPVTLKSFLLQERMKYEFSGGVRLGSVMSGYLRVPFRFRGEITRQEGLERLRQFFAPKR